MVTQCPITSKIIRLVKLDGFLWLYESLEDALLSMKKNQSHDAGYAVLNV